MGIREGARGVGLVDFVVREGRGVRGGVERREFGCRREAGGRVGGDPGAVQRHRVGVEGKEEVVGECLSSKGCGIKVDRGRRKTAVAGEWGATLGHLGGGHGEGWEAWGPGHATRWILEGSRVLGSEGETFRGLAARRTLTRTAFGSRADARSRG